MSEPNALYDNTFEFNSLVLGGWILFNQYPKYPSRVLSLALITYMEKVTAYFLANTPISTVTDQNAATLLGTLTPIIGNVGASISQLSAALVAKTLTDVQIGDFGSACINADTNAWNIYLALGGECQNSNCPNPGSAFMTLSCFRDVCNASIVAAFNTLLNDMSAYDLAVNSATVPSQTVLNCHLNQVAANVATFMSLTVSDGYLVALQTYLNTQTGGVNATGTDLKTLCEGQPSQPMTQQSPLGLAFAKLTINVNGSPVNTFTQLLLNIQQEQFFTDYSKEGCNGGLCCPDLLACCSNLPLTLNCEEATGCTCYRKCTA